MSVCIYMCIIYIYSYSYIVIYIPKKMAQGFIFKDQK